ncbi:MAG: SoxR reducing system RseC family protein [Deltaproteobacteria bacterium]|nr:SoxR reducing system RseC family protein [Deltaproteobacteria bacterium]
MIFERAKVVGLDADKAIIAKETSSACEGCHLSGSCMSAGDVRCDKTFVALNKLGAKVGDQVEIGLSTGEFFISVLLIYLLPLILLFVGFVLGTHLAPFMEKRFGAPMDPTAVAVVFGVVFLAGSFALLYTFNRWCKKRGLFLPKIVRVLS